MKNALSSVTEQFCILLPLWDIVSFCVIFQELRTETDKLELLITQVNNDVDVLSADEVFGEVDELTELLMQVNSKWQSLRSHVTTTEHNFQILEENYPTFTGNVRILQLLSLKISTSLRMGHLSCMAPRSGWEITVRRRPRSGWVISPGWRPAQDGLSLLHGTPLRMGRLSCMAPRSGWVVSPAWRRGGNSKFCFLEVLSHDPQNIHDRFHRPQPSGLRALGFWKCWHRMDTRKDGHLTGFTSHLGRDEY